MNCYRQNGFQTHSACQSHRHHWHGVFRLIYKTRDLSLQWLLPNESCHHCIIHVKNELTSHNWFGPLLIRTPVTLAGNIVVHYSWKNDKSGFGFGVGMLQIIDSQCFSVWNSFVNQSNVQVLWWKICCKWCCRSNVCIWVIGHCRQDHKNSLLMALCFVKCVTKIIIWELFI